LKTVENPYGPLVLALAVLGAPAASQAPAPRGCAAATAASATAAVTRVPIEVTNNHVYVAVCAGTRALDFLLDTGAAPSFFDLGTAKSLGAELGQAFTAYGAGAGTVAGARLRNMPVVLAGTDVMVTLSSAIDFSSLTPREGRVIEGVLGHDFLERFVVTIDYAGGELRLQDRRTFRDDPATSIPITFVGNHPHVAAEIRLADGGTARGTFVVDVGSSLALGLARPFVEQHRLRTRVGKTVRRPGGGGVGGPADADYGRIPFLRIGGVEVRDVVTLMFGENAGVFSGNESWGGNIGSDILRRFVVTFDYQGRRMFLAPHARTAEPFESDMSGGTFVGNAGLTQILVDFVVPGTAAAEAGLRKGDVVTAVDGQPIGPRSLLDLRQRLRREGERVSLTVQRGGAPVVVALTTRRIV
jgi:predicted aspartyl protease